MGLMYIFIFMIANAVISNGLAFVVTEADKIKVKPFNCYGCLVFWFTSIIGTLGALCFKQTIYELIVIAVLQGLVNFYYYNSKFKINE